MQAAANTLRRLAQRHPRGDRPVRRPTPGGAVPRPRDRRRSDDRQPGRPGQHDHHLRRRRAPAGPARRASGSTGGYSRRRGDQAWLEHRRRPAARPARSRHRRPTRALGRVDHVRRLGLDQLVLRPDPRRARLEPDRLPLGRRARDRPRPRARHGRRRGPTCVSGGTFHGAAADGRLRRPPSRSTPPATTGPQGVQSDGGHARDGPGPRRRHPVDCSPPSTSPRSKDIGWLVQTPAAARRAVRVVGLHRDRRDGRSADRHRQPDRRHRRRSRVNYATRRHRPGRGRLPGRPPAR